MAAVINHPTFDELESPAWEEFPPLETTKVMEIIRRGFTPPNDMDMFRRGTDDHGNSVLLFRGRSYGRDRLMFLTKNFRDEIILHVVVVDVKDPTVRGFFLSQTGVGKNGIDDIIQVMREGVLTATYAGNQE